MKLLQIFVVGVLGLFASCAAASAQSTVKTWVSSVGSDTGLCDISAPCGSIQYALNQTVAGGEVEVRDPGNYAPFVITRSVSVISSTGGATLSDYNSSNAGVTVAAGVSDIVTLRGLTINGHNVSGTYGIKITSGKAVIIDHCIISGASYGMYFPAPNTYVMITNNLITQNYIGIDIGTAAYVAAGGNTIAGNNLYGIYNGTIYTYGDNEVNTNNLADENSVTSHAVSKF